MFGLVDILIRSVRTEMKARTQVQILARVYLAWALAAGLIFSNVTLVSGATPDPGLEAQTGPVTIQDGTCWPAAFIWKVNATTTGSQGFQTCDGNVLLQRVRVYLDRCTVELPPGNCVTWEMYANFTACYRNGPGPLWCPAAGSFMVYALSAGRYKTRVFGEVWSTLGAYATGQAESNSVVLP